MRNILMKNILWCLVFVFSVAGICSAQSVVYLPQFADGAPDRNTIVWGTIIGVTNPAALGSPAASGSITLTQDNGSPMNVVLLDAITLGPSSTFQLAGGQTKLFFSPSNIAPIP